MKSWIKPGVKCLAISAILAGITLPAMAVSNLYVAIDGVDNDDPGRGQSWALPYATISNGIAHASTVGDNVVVSNGIYNAPASTYGLYIGRGVTVISLNGTGVTFISGTYPAATNRCVTLDHVYAVLSGFTITNGWSSVDSGTYRGGGGVTIGGASGSGGLLTNCLIKRCAASRGGGVAVSTGEIWNCVITENYQTNGTSGGGGGVYIYGSYGNRGVMFNSQILNNTSQYGGGGVSFEQLANTVIISNCLIAGNYARNDTDNNSGGGGMLLMANNRAQIINSVISNNIASNIGGGIFFSSSGSATTMLKDSDIVWNRSFSGQGGGGMQRSYAVTYPIIVSNCFIAYNQTINGHGGGGIGSDDYGWSGSQFDIVDCRVIANTSSGNAGGGFWLRGRYSLLRCQVVSNSAGNGDGGGIYIAQAANSSIRNCLIYGNNSGIYLRPGATGSVDSCTIANNIYFQDATITNVTVSNSVIWGAAISGWSDHSNQFYYSCSTGINFSQGNITNDPLFISSGARNYRLAKDSPSIDAGTNQDWMTNAVDLDMRMRIRYGRVDMGAYEVIYSGSFFTVH